MGVRTEIGTCNLFLWLQGRVWKSFPEPVCFLRHRWYHGLMSWFTEPVFEKLLLLEFAPSFWNKLGLLVAPGPVRCCLLWHTVESFWKCPSWSTNTALAEYKLWVCGVFPCLWAPQKGAGCVDCFE